MIRLYGARTVKENSYTANLSKQYTGTLLGVIFFYFKFSKHLTDHGFIQNKYDMCTLNKMVNGEQEIFQFHVDDLKVSHKDQAVLDNLDKTMN